MAAPVSPSTDVLASVGFPPALGRGLYAIADADACALRQLDVVQCALAMLRAGVAAVQLRAKGRSAEATLQLASAIVRSKPPHSPPFIVNDRADVARIVGADGVHVGQSDLPAAKLVAQAGPMLVGQSTHDVTQLQAALQIEHLSYVALGPIFPTGSKASPEPVVGIETLETCWAWARARAVPLVAIGGATRANLTTLSARCDMVAAIGVLLPGPGLQRPYDWIERQCRDLQAEIVSQRR